MFAIPNHVIRELYFQLLQGGTERRNQISIPNQSLTQAIELLALQNDIQPLLNEMQRVLQVLSNRDFMKMDEKYIKTLLLTLLYHSPVYYIQSERENESPLPRHSVAGAQPVCRAAPAFDRTEIREKVRGGERLGSEAGRRCGHKCKACSCPKSLHCPNLGMRGCY